MPPLKQQAYSVDEISASCPNVRQILEDRIGEKKFSMVDVRKSMLSDMQARQSGWVDGIGFAPIEEEEEAKVEVSFVAS